MVVGLDYQLGLVVWKALVWAVKLVWDARMNLAGLVREENVRTLRPSVYPDLLASAVQSSSAVDCWRRLVKVAVALHILFVRKDCSAKKMYARFAEEISAQTPGDRVLAVWVVWEQATKRGVGHMLSRHAVVRQHHSKFVKKALHVRRTAVASESEIAATTLNSAVPQGLDASGRRVGNDVQLPFPLVENVERASMTNARKQTSAKRMCVRSTTINFVLMRLTSVRAGWLALELVSWSNARSWWMLESAVEMIRTGYARTDMCVRTIAAEFLIKVFAQTTRIIAKRDFSVWEPQIRWSARYQCSLESAVDMIRSGCASSSTCVTLTVSANFVRVPFVLQNMRIFACLGRGALVKELESVSRIRRFVRWRWYWTTYINDLYNGVLFKSEELLSVVLVRVLSEVGWLRYNDLQQLLIKWWGSGKWAHYVKGWPDLSETQLVSNV